MPVVAVRFVFESSKNVTAEVNENVISVELDFMKNPSSL